MLDLRLFNTADTESATTLSAFSGPAFAVPDSSTEARTEFGTEAVSYTVEGTHYEMSSGAVSSTAASNSRESAPAEDKEWDVTGIQEVSRLCGS